MSFLKLMLKKELILGLVAITISLMMVTSFQEVLAEPYWGNLKIDIEKSVRIEGEKADVIVIKGEITNNDNDPITIIDWYVVLRDSGNSDFSASNYERLQSRGHSVTERECPYTDWIELNPRLSEDFRFCFEVPKENQKYTLSFYEDEPDYCRNPTWGSCQERHVNLTVNPPSPKSSSSTSNLVCDPSNPDVCSSKGEIKLKTKPTSVNYTDNLILEGTSSYSNYAIHLFDEKGNSYGLVKTSSDKSFKFIIPAQKIYDKIGSSPKMYLSINPNTYHETKTNFTFTIKKEIKPLDTNPPKLLAPNDIIVQSKNSVGEKVSFEIQSIDDVDTKIFPSCNPQSGAFFPIGKTVVKCNAMDSSGNRAEQVTFSIIVESTKTSVPEWVKNNAKWWSDGQVDDSTFSQGIGFLIKEKVISVSSLPPQASAVAQEKVPDWIKNNAKWWADGMISEDDFLKGITYMVEKGIVKVQ